ncbi:putative inactive glycosyltransferase 25 family member 3, partial [Nestor notabilis]
ATDHNLDNTTAMLQEWLSAVGKDYHSVAWKVQEEPSSYPDELGPKHWSDQRYENLMRLKQEALTYAREQRADYILGPPMVEVLPTMEASHRVPQGYYRRTADYFPTKNRQRVGCFSVPMVYATFLIDLRKEDTSRLAFYPPH